MGLRLGTRGSALARHQAETVAAGLRARGLAVDLVVIRTLGDRRPTARFQRLGAPGVFTRELEEALRRGEIDLAVHSLKDLPGLVPDDLAVVAVLERRDPADVLVYRPTAGGEGSPPLKKGATVGTASARREALLRELRPDLELRFLRGNVTTRLERVAAGVVDAVVLAAAGLARLVEGGNALPPGLRRHRLAPAAFPPAPGQGALAVEMRADHPARAAVAALDDPEARRTTTAERALLRLVGAGCNLPFGAHAAPEPDGRLRLRAALARDGRLRRVELVGVDPEALAAAAYAQLMEETHGHVRPDREDPRRDPSRA